MSFFVTRKSAEPATTVPLTYVDILYDHAGYLSTHGRLGSGSLAGKSIGIVGAGAAGLAAATLLVQMGAAVTIYEQDSRAGGRIFSQYPIPGDAAIFEMGAMRVPPSERLFQYFAGLYNMQPGGQFPDPGKVFTQIIFENQKFDWKAGDDPPDQFTTVYTSWKNLVNTKLVPITTYLTDPNTFTDAQAAWQQLIYNDVPPGPEQGYSTISFYQGLVQAFVENYKQYGDEWGTKEFALFGALGVGSGGFGPLYQVNFAEIARLIVNGLEADQQFYPGGLSALIEGFKSQLSGDTISYGSKVTSVQSLPGGQVQVKVDGKPPTQFDAVIIATTTRAMQVDMGLTDLPPLPKTPVLDDQNTAIREIHLMNSSKLFVLTKNKFWNPPQGQPAILPANIQTDGLVRGLYCLDYLGTDYGVVLISYTWGDDSTKCIAIQKAPARLEILLDSLEALVPDFVSALKDQIMPDYTTMIDWQMEPSFYGAFKLNYPGQDPLNRALYYQFLNSTNGIYLAGDSVGWCGGWIEGALQTGVNAAAAVVNQLGGSLFPNNPMTQTSQYTYGP